MYAHLLSIPFFLSMAIPTLILLISSPYGNLIPHLCGCLKGFYHSIVAGCCISFEYALIT